MSERTVRMQYDVPAKVQPPHEVPHSLQVGLLLRERQCLPRLAAGCLIQPHQTGEGSSSHEGIIASFVGMGACLRALHHNHPPVSPEKLSGWLSLTPLMGS